MYCRCTSLQYRRGAREAALVWFGNKCHILVDLASLYVCLRLIGLTFLQSPEFYLFQGTPPSVVLLSGIHRPDKHVQLWTYFEKGKCAVAPVRWMQGTETCLVEAVIGRRPEQHHFQTYGTYTFTSNPRFSPPSPPTPGFSPPSPPTSWFLHLLLQTHGSRIFTSNLRVPPTFTFNLRALPL